MRDDNDLMLAAVLTLFVLGLCVYFVLHGFGLL